jgi:hypothetical protein
MKSILINAAIFQLGWLCCVLAGANQLPWLGTATAMLIVAWHVLGANDGQKELSLVLIVVGIGAVWDSLLVYAGLLQYPSGTLISGTAPHWIIAMWALFATTLNVSLRWLKNRPLLGALLGAISGPAAYFAGYKLGGVQFPDMNAALLALAGGWAVLMPLLMTLSNRFDGKVVQPPHAALAGCNARV